MCLCTVFISLESLAQSATVQITASETYLGKAASGIISIRYSNITLGLRRPLIVAEGFDPGHITSPEKRFGETNINTGFLDEARDIILSANLAALLGGSTQQYDIVYVNWSNGTDYMQRNALLLEEVIRWVNNNKVAVGGVVQPNVVLGQSMGGVIARWTLKDMEDKGQNHQTRLFISYDAPHQGANVPQGYQHLARHTRDLYVKAAPLAGPVETIQFFRGRQSPFHALSLSNEPAARQMLVNYINDINLIDNSLHNAWQTELKNKGYPQGVSGIAFRRVAVSNGSECATSQPFAAGSVLLSYNGKGKASFWGDLAADVVMPAVSLTLNQPAMGLGLTLPGNTSMSFEMEVKSKADGSSNQVYKGKVTYTKKVLGLINVTAVLTNRSFTSSSSTLPYDNFPGGYYDVSKAFDLSSSPISNDLIKFNATVQQQPNFCFIPTPSALDIGGGNVSLAKADYLTSYVGATPPSAPKNTPFQNFITAFSDGSANNEEHISILRRNGDWVAAELNNTNPVANCSVFCNSLSITGTAALCTSATYSVQAIAGATYTWTALPAGSVTFSGSGNSVTATRNGTYSGNATIKVLVSLAACGTGFPSLPVTVGPQPTAAVYGDWDNPLKIIVGADPVTGATSYKWYVNNVYIKSTTNPNTSLPYNGDCYTSVTVGVEVVTSCGTSGKTNTNIGTAPCDNFYIIAPNPAQDIITITADGQTGMAAKAGTSSPSASSITQVKIYNAHGAAVKTIQYTGTTKQAQVNVADLTAGLYFIEVSNGNNRQTKKLVIAR
ncbi:T9SS type A sorting domain-containing protein [Agriterribacter sp.]|uniref:T9SS type A sorting domain-containing protein n=1 Tax=Agriterribacter sp. TaxID=2821509 RepID=UPI002BC1F642|nr:T9SS type A sorting domain-containing protein [Agriterribacter sp.]HTN05434.1 T9SS type A sorting domain-containing protein [Agriterribacter sp.]